MQERFGRDAADVHAHPAELLLLDDGGREAQLRGADGAHVSRGTATENDYVKRIGHERSS